MSFFFFFLRTSHSSKHTVSIRDSKLPGNEWSWSAEQGVCVCAGQEEVLKQTLFPAGQGYRRLFESKIQRMYEHTPLSAAIITDDELAFCYTSGNNDELIDWLEHHNWNNPRYLFIIFPPPILTEHSNLFIY